MASSSATTLNYNGASLIGCLTKSFHEEIIYDASNTDMVYHKFTIRVVCWVHSFSDLGLPTNTFPRFATVPALQHAALRELLLHPRGDFSFVIAGNTVLIASPTGAGNGLAVDNGPRPRFCSINEIGGSGVLRIEFEIEVSIVDCQTNNNNQNVLSNRWSVEDVYDQDWYCTRTIVGRLVLATANSAKPLNNPQMFRGIVVPPLQYGFRREAMHFLTNPNGLELDYVIQDKQVWAVAPYPATSWTASHSISTGDGITSYAEIDISVKGPPGVNKQVLVQLAAQILELRLQVNSQQFKAGQFKLEQAAIVDVIHDSAILMRCRILSQSDPTQFFGMAGRVIGSDPHLLGIPNYDPGIGRSPSSDDLDGLALLWKCYLQSPCDDNHQINQTQVNPPSYSSGETGSYQPRTTQGIGSLGQDLFRGADWSPAQRESLYTYYRVRNRYPMYGMRVQLPIGASSLQGQGTSEGPGSNTPSATMVTLAPRVAQRIVEIEAMRAGDWPDIQGFADILDPNLGDTPLLDCHYENEPPQIGPDGQMREYIVRATYTYALVRAPGPGEFMAPALPWQNLGTGPQGSDAIVPAASLIDGINDPLD